MIKYLDYVDMDIYIVQELYDKQLQINHNGKKVENCIEALAGENGYALCFTYPYRTNPDGSVVLVIIDGNIEITLEDE